MRLLILLVAIMSVMSGCKAKNTDSTIIQAPPVVQNLDTLPTQTDIDIATVRKMMNNSKDIVLLDVRTKEEVDAGKIENALNIDFNKQDFATQIEKLDKNKPYIVYCAVGGRSSKAATYMKANGFHNVYNMLGGYNQWVEIK